MKKIQLTFAVALITTVCFQSASADQSHKSHYAGQEKRDIKSLSSDDIVQLKNGSGWGLAKVAELNGLPGPAHILELQSEIELTDDQLSEIQSLHSEMKEKAITIGKQFVDLEAQLEKQFQSNLITDEGLKSLLNEIENKRSQLRYIHLSTHLKTPHILTKQQVESYNKLRGYSSNDPCEYVPDGHDEKMWRKHIPCE